MSMSNINWSYRKRKDKSAHCTSIHVTPELNEKYLAQIETKERELRAAIRRSGFTIDNAPRERQRNFEVLIDDETEHHHSQSSR
jgi:hypothetical protein